MKREDISDALGLLDESMISHTLMVRRKKKKMRSNRNSIWKMRYVAAAAGFIRRFLRLAVPC